jgi:hypothetical protein
VAVHVPTRLVRGATLHGFRGLTELQVDAQPVSACGLDIRRGIDD